MRALSMTARIVLLVTSPRLPAGLLTAAAWDVVRAAPVLAGAESELTTAVRVGRAPRSPWSTERRVAGAARRRRPRTARRSGWPARPATRRSPGSWACGWPASRAWPSWS